MSQTWHRAGRTHSVSEASSRVAHTRSVTRASSHAAQDRSVLETVARVLSGFPFAFVLASVVCPLRLRATCYPCIL